MQQPIVLRSPHHPLSDSQEQLIRGLAEKLERHYPRVIACEVSVEPPPKGRSGGPFHVHVEVRVPGKELHVREEDAALEAALRSAFAAATRRLEDYSQKQRNAVKRHEPNPREVQS